ncbi:40S ribosomal protein S15a, partial [Striga asiatica]
MQRIELNSEKIPIRAMVVRYTDVESNEKSRDPATKAPNIINTTLAKKTHKHLKLIQRVYLCLTRTYSSIIVSMIVVLLKAVYMGTFTLLTDSILASFIVKKSRELKFEKSGLSY